MPGPKKASPTSRSALATPKSSGIFCCPKRRTIGWEIRAPTMPPRQGMPKPRPYCRGVKPKRMQYQPALITAFTAKAGLDFRPP